MINHHRSIWYEKGYPGLAEVENQKISMKDLQKDDIAIFVEGDECPIDLVKRGVKVYIWALGSYDYSQHKADGCKFFSHNHHLTKQYDVDLARDHVVIPYINIQKKHFGSITNDKRQNLVILNHQDNGGAGFEVLGELQDYCKSILSCEVYYPEGLNVEKLNAVYMKAKVVFAPCMRGSERGPIEAVLAGVVLVINECDSGSNSMDFPIPKEHMVSDKNPLLTLVRKIFDNFEEEQSKLEGFREVYKSYDHASMVEDTKMFFQSAVASGE